MYQTKKIQILILITHSKKSVYYTINLIMQDITEESNRDEYSEGTVKSPNWTTLWVERTLLGESTACLPPRTEGRDLAGDHVDFI